MKSEDPQIRQPAGRGAPQAVAEHPSLEPLLPASLDFVGWRRLDDGALELRVRYVASTGICPHCQEPTSQVHARRLQRKQDRDWQEKPLWLVLERRRYRCWHCRRVFTEPDPVCGFRRRSTRRRREAS